MASKYKIPALRPFPAVPPLPRFVSAAILHIGHWLYKPLDEMATTKITMSKIRFKLIIV